MAELDVLFMFGLAVTGILIWLWLKLAFAMSGSKRVMTMVLFGAGLALTQIVQLPILFIPLLGLGMQVVYNDAEPLETASITGIVLVVALFLQTTV